jgi:hypothetical protein
LRQELTQNRSGARIQRHVEVDAQAVLGVIRSLTGQRKAVPIRLHYIDFDVG